MAPAGGKVACSQGLAGGCSMSLLQVMLFHTSPVRQGLLDVLLSGGRLCCGHQTVLLGLANLCYKSFDYPYFCMLPLNTCTDLINKTLRPPR